VSSGCAVDEPVAGHGAPHLGTAHAEGGTLALVLIARARSDAGWTLFGPLVVAAAPPLSPIVAV
jgi:hypothetical protein